jgi:hypothetical protein
MRILLFFPVLFLAPLVIFSQDANQNSLQLNTITTALPFMAITPDSRAGGMGEAGTALSPSATSVYWNTAGLSFAEKNSEISLSYTPWLRQLTNDMHLSYLSGYYRVNKKHSIGGALRYFSLGEITFTDASGNVLRDDKPSEFELTGAYAFKLSDKFSIGVNGKFAYSNLTGGLTVAGVMTKPGKVGAADLSFAYYNDRIKLGKTSATYQFAATINNIGNKVAYSVLAKRDFIPMNLKIGNAIVAKYDSYNSVTYSIDIQRLLVPTPAFYDKIDGENVMLSGKSGDVGVINGMLQSFYDAPGVVATDENGDYIVNGDGTYQIVKGSKFKEELSEINIAGGIEWWYNETFAVRTGVFYESRNKGNRQYLNLGASLKYNMFGIDFSYLASLNGRQNPLSNTLRFTLRLYLGEKKVKSAHV